MPRRPSAPATRGAERLEAARAPLNIKADPVATTGKFTALIKV